jgi:hypothetical protein
MDVLYDIVFGYQPVRSDGVKGVTCYSTPYSLHTKGTFTKKRSGTECMKVKPSIREYSIQGTTREGEVVSFYGTYVLCESSDCEYQWYRCATTGELIAIPNATETQYKLTAEDIGFKLQCTVQTKDKTGKKGDTITTTSDNTVEAGVP